MAKDYYTVKECAKKLDRHPDTVYQWLRRGIIPYRRVTPHSIYEIPKSEVRRLKKLIHERAVISEPAGKQESPPAERANQSIHHDEEIFRKSDSIINEGELLQFLDRLEFNNTYVGPTLKKVKEFRDPFWFQTNKYVDDELTGLCDELVNALTKLIRFLEFSFKAAGDTETINAYDDDVYRFNPQDRYLREREEYFEKLLQLTNTVRVGYSAYRAAVRTKLLS